MTMKIVMGALLGWMVASTVPACDENKASVGRDPDAATSAADGAAIDDAPLAGNGQTGGVVATGGMAYTGGATVATSAIATGGTSPTGGAIAIDAGDARGTGGITASGGAPGMGGAIDAATPATIVVRYAWTAVWGPCQPVDVPCKEELVATNGGTVTYTLHGAVRSAILTSSDLAAFQQFLADAKLVAAISSTTACPAIGVDRTETVALTLASSGAPLSKNVFGCTGEEYEVISNWTKRLRAYFP